MGNDFNPKEWSDEQIIEYLRSYWECEDFVFDCNIDDKPYKTGHPENFKGSITNISYNRKFICYPYNRNQIFFNISTTTKFQFLKGRFKMRFELESRERRESLNNMFMLRPVYGSLYQLNEEKMRVLSQKRAEQGKTKHSSAEKELFEYWGVSDCNFIGYYHYDQENEISIVDDIRKSNFAKIPYYPNDAQKLPISLHYKGEIKGIVSDNYYLFNWRLSGNNPDNPYEIYIDFHFQPQPIRPQWFIDQLFDDRYNDKSKNFESSANFLDTLSKQLSAKESTFIYELLQNANDYPVEGVPVDVEFHINDKYLVFMHSGDYFNVRNISGICGINEKEKTANIKTIGYKGIGFKTVFLNNHYVYIKTGDYSFRFDEKARKIKRLEAPWPILPVWTAEDEVEPEIASIFNAADKKYRVKIALKPDNPAILHSGRKNYEALFRDVFDDSNLILFIPNIRSVKVYINGVLERNCVIDEAKWLVSDYEEDINEELQALVNKDIDTGKSRIPEKYKDFERTKVSFACRKDGRKLLPIENANLYCYLPTSATWGFSFLMNTDMIPKGDRDDIEREVYLKNEDETNFNLELTRIAGEKFFCWIRDLMESGKYDYDSIFALIPDFDKCKKAHGDKYDDFIEMFQIGFEKKMEEEGIIPVVENKSIVLKAVDDVIYDITGLSCSSILTDDEILTMSDWSDFFPHPLLRDYDKLSLRPGIKSFLSRYHSENQEYDIDVLLGACEGEGFQEWLHDQIHNEEFIAFLLKKGIINSFNDSTIFLSENNGLFAPDGLYYSVDEYFDDLKALDGYLDRLSLKTRAAFESDKKWDTFKSCFVEFNPDNFVDNVLLDEEYFDDVHELLSTESASLPFMRFLASHVGYSTNYKKFPFLDQDGSIENNFTEKPFVFLPSSDAVSVREKDWIDADWIAVVSDKYDQCVIDYFSQNFELKTFLDKIIVEDIICSNDYDDSINSLIEDFATSKSFVEYLYAHKEYVKDNGLSSYLVSVIDKDGDEQFLRKDEEFIYIRNKTYNEYEVLEWVEPDYMYAVNEAYYEGSGEVPGMKTFFNEKYGIPTMTSKLFLDDVIDRQSKGISDYIQDFDQNIFFWRWVKMFAKDVVIIPAFSQFPLLVKTLDDDEYDCMSAKDSGIYLSNEYQPSSSIEAIVKRYAPEAQFVASDYLEDKASGTVTSWVEFFKNLGVKTTIVDLVFGQIIPNIGEIEEDGLPDLLGDYYQDIQDRWDEVKKKLKTIKIKTQDGNFTKIRKCILVDVGREKEPFPDIKFGNEVSANAIKSRSGRKLLLDIAEEADGIIINNITAWQEKKFNEYAGCENSYSIDIHLRIMRELAAIDVETIKKFGNLNYLRLLDRNDEYQEPKKLTLGTKYNPSCHFERNGVRDGILFVSDRYVSINDEDKFSLFLKNVLRCHHRFEDKDLTYLKNYRFCVYFWAEYVPKHVEFVEGLIEENKFDDIECVPTLAGNVYVPTDVYSRSIEKYVVNKIPDWEDKLPTSDIPENEEKKKDLFSKLELSEQLSFRDGLSALQTIKSKEKREKILRWMEEDYDSSYASDVTEYRAKEDAIWKNGKGEDKHITELYGLAPESKTLRDFFRDNKHVINSEYISSWVSSDYRSICEMMQIPIIEKKDMSFAPDGKPVSNLTKYFEKRILVVAAIEDPEGWQKSFEKYKEKIGGYEFWCCSSISWKYSKNEEICQNNKKFFSKDGKYYFVKDWCSRQVFADFIRTLYEDLGCELNQDQFLTIMDPEVSVDESLEPYYSIRTDEFIKELAKYDSDYKEYTGPIVAEEEEDDDDTMAAYAPIRTYKPMEQEETHDLHEDQAKYGEPYNESEETAYDEEIPENEDEEEPVVDEIDDNNESVGERQSEPATKKRKPSLSNKPLEKPSSPLTAGKTKAILEPAAESEADYEDSEPENVDIVDKQEENFFEDTFDPDEGEPMGSVEKDRAYQQLGEKPRKPQKARRYTKPYTQEEVNRLRSNGTPLELESLPATDEELDVLAQCGISPEQIADTNYLAQLRLYRNLQKELNEEPEESLVDFIRNADDVSEHKMKSGKFIHACSAARGVMYVSPTVWNKMLDDKWVICIYLDGKGKNFHYINTAEEFLKLVQKDDVVIKITGNEKVDVVNDLYSGLLKGVKGTAYTLVRVAARTNMDAVFAHYVGAMAETNDGNENPDEY
nr:hypothetical protein [uncultured Alistipes sp.]